MMKNTIETLNPNSHKAASSTEKNLITKIMGKFYTPKLVGQPLVEAILKVVEKENFPVPYIIDPFCGDGRLVCWLLEALVGVRDLQNLTLNIELWDADQVALKTAANNVFQSGLALKLRLNVQVKTVNTFEYALKRTGEFNIVITNPPWEILKPDSRELKQLSLQEVKAYKNWLKDQDELLTKLYPLSQPLRKFSGWGTNLARCGTEAALRLTAHRGVCGIISPASLMADQMTEKLRRWILQEHIIHELAYYPAEARLFDQVDQSSITLVATPGKSEQFFPLIKVYNRQVQIKSCDYLSLNWEDIEANSFILPVHFGAEQIRLFKKWQTFPQFCDLEATCNEFPVTQPGGIKVAWRRRFWEGRETSRQAMR